MPLIQVYLPTSPIDDDATVDRMHRRLRTYLDDSGVVDVQPVRSDEVPEGSRSAGSVALGIFTVVITGGISGATSALVAALIGFVKRSNREVKVRAEGIEITVDVKTANADPAVVAKLLTTITDEEVGA